VRNGVVALTVSVPIKKNFDDETGYTLKVRLGSPEG
jgi:hypothetical protein